MSEHETGTSRRVCIAAILLCALAMIASSAAQAQALWPALLAALDRDYRPGIEELAPLAAVLADAPEEVLIAWDRRGRFLFHAVGDSHQVWIPRRLTPRLEGSVLIHNHPSGLPPSPHDLDTVRRYRLRRLYVAARVDGVVSLTDIGRGEAVQKLLEGGSSGTRVVWRPVVEAPPALVVATPDVIASRIAYSLLGAWL